MGKHKRLDYKEYRQIFEDYINSNRPIKTLDGQIELKIEDDMQWQQAYDPDDNIRKAFPEYWFVSEKGDVVSVHLNGKRVYLLRKDDGGDGYYDYHMNIQNEDGTMTTKRLGTQNLVGLVFGAYAYGEAKEMLNEKGIYGFGRKQTGVSAVNGHHINADKKDNSYGNIEFVSTDIHNVIDTFPKGDAPVKKQVEYLKKFGRQAGKEVPNEISVLLSGHTWDRKTGEYLGDTGETYIYSTKKLPMTIKAMNQINNFSINALCSRLVQTVVEQLILDKGTEFFTEPKYLTIGTETFYRAYLQDGSVMQEEITYTDIPVGVELINCYIYDGFAGYYMEDEKEK